MRIVRTLESFPPDARPSVVALGVFDGVHLGHRAILDTAVARAKKDGGTAVACTFDPHPAKLGLAGVWRHRDLDHSVARLSQCLSGGRERVRGRSTERVDVFVP